MSKAKGIYRVIKTKFWSDNKVQDELNTTERLLFIYLLTNEKSNLAGCYELGLKKMSFETGCTIDECRAAIDHFVELKMVEYDESTGEIYIVNWAKNNWETSEKYMKGVMNLMEDIKSADFINKLQSQLPQ